MTDPIAENVRLPRALMSRLHHDGIVRFDRRSPMHGWIEPPSAQPSYPLASELALTPSFKRSLEAVAHPTHLLTFSELEHGQLVAETTLLIDDEVGVIVTNEGDEISLASPLSRALIRSRLATMTSAPSQANLCLPPEVLQWLSALPETDFDRATLGRALGVPEEDTEGLVEMLVGLNALAPRGDLLSLTSHALAALTALDSGKVLEVGVTPLAGESPTTRFVFLGDEGNRLWCTGSRDGQMVDSSTAPAEFGWVLLTLKGLAHEEAETLAQAII